MIKTGITYCVERRFEPHAPEIYDGWWSHMINVGNRPKMAAKALRGYRRRLPNTRFRLVKNTFIGEVVDDKDKNPLQD